MNLVPKAVTWWVVVTVAAVVEGVGVNWGTRAFHPLPPLIVTQLLKDNSITRVKLFDADERLMSALAGTDIEVMVAIPNGMLSTIAGGYEAAMQWVKENVTRYHFNGGVNIKYVAIGNEPFLQSYGDAFKNDTFPALQNIQRALVDAGHGDEIKATVPFNADVYAGVLPSQGKFRDDLKSTMVDILEFLNKTGAPFTVNIYPFLSLEADPGFPYHYAFFDGTEILYDNGTGYSYSNAFDANFDTLISALKDAGVPDLPIIIGETGWPTDGSKNGNTTNAKRFYDGLLRKLASNNGTHLKPGYSPETYLFALIDEDAKTTKPGMHFERHWGIFSYDGQPKFTMDLTGKDPGRSLMPAKSVMYLPRQRCVIKTDLTDKSAVGASVDFACTYSDCSSLGYSCNKLDGDGNASYAFNSYYQVQSQVDGSCDFRGLATVTAEDPSENGCRFNIEIDTSSSPSSRAVMSTNPPLTVAVGLACSLAMFLLHIPAG